MHRHNTEYSSVWEREREREGERVGVGEGESVWEKKNLLQSIILKSKAFMYLKNGNISVNFSVLIKDIISLNLNVFIADNDNNNMIM